MNALDRLSRLLLALLACLVFTSPAQATTSSSSFFWVISDTGFSSQHSALAMARGNAWPVIFGESDTITLFPTVGFGDSSWDRIDSGVGFAPRAASSPTGEVAGVSVSDFNSTGMRVNTLFRATPFTVSSGIDYSSSGALVRAEDFNHLKSFGSFGSSADVAVSPFGDIGVLESNEYYSSLTPGSSTNIDASTTDSFSGTGSLTFDAFGAPHAIDDGFTAFNFDLFSGQFVSTELAPNGANILGVPAIAADDTGVVGTAFVDLQNSDLIYAYYTALAGWQTTVVDNNVDIGYQVGLAYDYQNLPVISYSKNNSLWLAYDPIVPVPEPGTALALGGLASLGLAGRRRGRPDC